MFHHLFVKSFSGVAAALVASAAVAAPGDGPDLNINAEVDGRISSAVLAGTNIGGNNYLYGATLTDEASYAIEWQMVINNDAGSGVDKGYETLNGTITVANLSSKSMFYVIDTNFNINLAGDPVLYGGSFTGSLTGGPEGAMLNSIGSPLWSANLNNTAYQSFYDSPFDFAAMPFETVEIPAMAFGEPIPDLPGPDTFMMGQPSLHSNSALVEQPALPAHSSHRSPDQAPLLPCPSDLPELANDDGPDQDQPSVRPSRSGPPTVPHTSDGGLPNYRGAVVDSHL